MSAYACLLRQLSESESRDLSKYKMGDISKGVANIPRPSKKFTKKLQCQQAHQEYLFEKHTIH